MTKYICECLDGARKCIHETPSFSAPTLCCVRAHATCHWRKAENQEVEAPAPIIPDWCRTGAWVYVTPDNSEPFYCKIYGVTYSRVHNTTEVQVTLDGKSLVGVFTWSNVQRARLRPWDADELKSMVGEVFEMGNGDLTLCLGYQRDIADLIFVGKLMSAQSFAESDWKLDGLPCGVLEHYEQGEWVK